jgi:hypothetical protein
MARVLARLGLVIGAGLLTAAMTAGPAMAGPQAAEEGSASRSDGSKVPAPTRGGTAPTQPKTEIPRETGLRSGALAAHIDGICNSFFDGTGDLCLWPNTGYSGSHIDYFYGDDSVWNNVYLTAGSGQGAGVANNSESTYNYDTIWTAWVCTSTNQFGSCGYILPRHGGNFVPTFFNNTESLHWTL